MIVRNDQLRSTDPTESALHRTNKLGCFKTWLKLEMDHATRRTSVESNIALVEVGTVVNIPDVKWSHMVKTNVRKCMG